MTDRAFKDAALRAAGFSRADRVARKDRLNRMFFLASAVFMAIIILSIIGFVGRQGLMTFHDISPADFFGSTVWRPTEGRFGSLAFLWGSLSVTALALILGGPLGVAGAVFLAKVAPVAVRTMMRPATDLLVGIPSVVYGWIGLSIFIPAIRTWGGGSGYGVLATGLILGIMILPTVISIAEDSLRSLPSSLEEASYALGATRWQTVWKVLLPAARPGLLTGVILGMSRAMGETMAVQMVIGNSPLLATSLVMPTATLTSEIVTEMGNTPFGSTWNNALFTMAFLLLLVSLSLILVTRWVGGRGRANG